MHRLFGFVRWRHVLFVGVMHVLFSDCKIDFENMDPRQKDLLKEHLAKFVNLKSAQSNMTAPTDPSLIDSNVYETYMRHFYLQDYQHLQQISTKAPLTNLVFPRMDSSTVDCSRTALEYKKRDYGAFCQLAKTDCRSRGLINYMELPYCDIPTHTWVAVLILLLWLCVLLCWMFSTVKYSCPNLIWISSQLGINENVAGITLLAIGNSVPDLLSLSSSAVAAPGSAN